MNSHAGSSACDVSTGSQAVRSAASGVVGTTSRLQVCAAWWPDERLGTSPATASSDEAPAELAYIMRVRQLFGSTACVQEALTPWDERLALNWHARGIRLETVRRAWLLGCNRKLLSLIDRPAAAQIRSPRYFAPVLEDVLGQMPH